MNRKAQISFGFCSRSAAFAALIALNLFVLLPVSVTRPHVVPIIYQANLLELDVQRAYERRGDAGVYLIECGEPAHFLIAATGLPPLPLADRFMQVAQVAVIIVDEVSGESSRQLFGAHEVWAPSEGEEDLRFEVRVQLAPGRFRMQGVVYADPPYGAGLSGGEMQAPAAIISLRGPRPWISTMPTQHLLVEVRE